MKRFLSLLFIFAALFFAFGCEMNIGGDTTFKGITFESAEFSYDGQPKSIFVEGLPEDATVAYTGNGQAEVGTYEVVAVVTIGEKTKEFTATLRILSENTPVTMEGLTIPYDGQPHSLEVEGLPRGATVEYLNNGKVDAGNYVVIANVTYSDGQKTQVRANLVIQQAEPELIIPDNCFFDMEGQTKITSNAVLNNTEQTVSYTCNEVVTGPGVYNVTVVIRESRNYKGKQINLQLPFYPNKLNLSFEEGVQYYDGQPKSLQLNGELPEGYTVEYVGNSQTEVGHYNVQAKIKDESGAVYCNVYGVLVIDAYKNEEFEQYMDEVFVELFEGDQMSINFFIKNPENYGLDHYDARLPLYEEYEESDYSEEYAEACADLDHLASLVLSLEERETLEILRQYVDYIYSITKPMGYMSNGYLGSYLGYQANLPLDLAEYKFRNEQDIIDFLEYMEFSLPSFQSYYQFSVKQNEYGYGLSDTAIDNVVSQCEKFVAEQENHYLIEIFNSKIDAIEFELSDEKVAGYKARMITALATLCEAYQYVADNLPNLKGGLQFEGGLFNYDNDGVEYYRLLMGHELGYPDFDIEEAAAYIDRKAREANAKVNGAVNQYRSMSAADQNTFITAVNDGKPYYSSKEYDALLQEFIELSSKFVPDLEEMPEITIKYVYESLEDNFSPACYFVSPIDETRYESIYLNGKYTDDKNYVFTTLAHEGYPGHLYQNVYTKSLDINDIRRVIRCGGYMEGWATYMEINAYSWVENYVSTPLKVALQYNKYNDILNGLISCRLDIGIHGQGWTLADCNKWLSDTLDISGANITDFYTQITEIPGNMSKYFYSWSKLMDMHDYAKEQLGYLFSEVAINKVILDCGAAPLSMVEEAVQRYVSETLYHYGFEIE